mmetsp:Transcript_28582/g.53580  ORF Transcript_28582/g.53580 Transcript_28582/m.53580 type:complete len:365 (-) Transcript_28582:523-1617(-)|eukprot:CAMPEP_0170166606 /NCGR_PEP_ID=MMETSP0040_2-20121228/251_1 /TAXON_ID=641309 /ORGANISM="Lotharella oceanica, Strain CCMP622" /LENGTH=364 /DNA_ID=CAMNT_0010404375 /DNA_START=76 /DNA_END=1170 /DNA_ORIENTATION=+
MPKSTLTFLVLLSVSSIVERVALAMEQAADFSADLIEGIGSILEDFLVSVANEDALKDVSWVKPFLFYLGRCACAWFVLGSAIVKSGTSIATGLLQGWVGIFLGVISLDKARVRGGMGSIAAGIIGAVTLYVGCLISFLQTCAWVLQPRHRALNPKERKILEVVFRRSLAMPNVRVVEGHAGVFTAIVGRGDHNAFGLGDTIFANDNELSSDQLIRACIGVWRYQHYGAGCLGSHLLERLLAGGQHGWQKQIDSEGKKDWMMLSEGAKACFHEDVYDYGELLNGKGAAGQQERKEGEEENKAGDGVFYGVDRAGPTSKNRFVWQGKDYTEFANNSVDTIRRMVSRRISAGWNPKPPAACSRSFQ